MWIVRLTLRRTYTFVVMALLIAVLGAVGIYRTSTDVFPEIDIPVVSIELVAGLKEGDTVVVHPGDDLPAGTIVQPVLPSK
jgi:hypothetical protein